MELLQIINKFSLKPISEAAPIVKYKKYMNWGINNNSSDSFKVRFLFLAQVIISLVAIPILLIIGLLATILNVCSDRDDDSFEKMLEAIKLHLIYVIPTSVVGIAAPWATTVKIAEGQAECLGKSLLPSTLKFTFF